MSDLEFGPVLIANRGEIACRIIRTCKRLGIKTVAVYSEADKASRHVKMADEAILIGPAQAKLSYLNLDRIFGAAKESGAKAIHPGYGFLAENTSFAERCAAEGIVFIGPDAKTISQMGDKAAARAAAISADVPVVPGSDTVDASDALTVGEKLGFPIMIKAAAGGGGRGIRIVHSAVDLETAFAEASREATAAFGDGRIYIEKVVQNARHVEVQVLGDGKGNVVHLYDRDCSLQRKRQKLIEEAPSPALSPVMREKISEAAVRLAAKVCYKNAGTMEFLATSSKFYFIEMNTRIQVEHPITEMITGVDVVEQQLRIAAIGNLAISQSDVKINGVAFEFRVNAEDPQKGFMPSPGTISVLDLPARDDVRMDFGVDEGGAVVPFYDSMVGKIIVWAPDRREAIARAADVLAASRIEGIKTTIPLHRDVLAQDWFAKCDFNTMTLEKYLEA
ncbi:acetyl/propionyl/methylcrotonyl-CoA carboxylase subunit alpha [Agrobacterium sp. NPDC090283]|uniref:acetyl-CoA carboxylase biotin carboxylase subunit n=1 Tax=Agrobacterium sp. NPDC090283 TaxID=3363920 RepID=UPI003839F98E